MKVKSESEVAQSCPTLSDPVDCSPLGSSIHGIFQARVLEWGAIAFWGDLNGKEIQKSGDICICKADSFCYKQKLTQQCKGTILKKKKKERKIAVFYMCPCLSLSTLSGHNKEIGTFIVLLGVLVVNLRCS